MSRKLRYLIIACGFIIFLVLAPLIVFYVRGLAYNMQAKNFVQTGLFAIRTDPAKTNIFLDGRPDNSNGGDIKFLPPGEYGISISQDGYFTWQKRLTILANQVTWVSPSPNKLFLFLASSSPSSVSGNVKDFALSGGNLLFLNNDTLSVAGTGNLAQTTDFTPPKKVDRLQVSPDGNLVLLQSGPAQKTADALVFDRAARNFSDIGSLFAAPAKFSFGNGNNLYALSNSGLYKIDPAQKTKTALAANIKTFAWLGKDLYYIQKTPGNGNALFVSGQDGSNAQKLLDGIPDFSDGQIFVTQQKQIFLLADSVLYKINGGPDRLAGGITALNFDQNAGTLIFVHDGEVSNYNFSQQLVDFITRSDQVILNPILQQYTSTAFLLRGNTLAALELDTRDRQNEYDFYKGLNMQKFLVDDQAKNLFILDGGELKILKIR